MQQRALRYFLGVHSKTPSLAIEGDTGWLNTEVRRHTEMFRFWNHIIKMDATRLSRKVFETEYGICNNIWCSEIKQLFEKVNKIYIYHNKHTCDIYKMLNNLHKVFTGKWLNDIQLKNCKNFVKYMQTIV